MNAWTAILIAASSLAAPRAVTAARLLGLYDSLCPARGLRDLDLFELRLRSLPPAACPILLWVRHPVWRDSGPMGRELRNWPVCPGCGEPIGVYERLWYVAPQIGAEPTSWLQPRPCALPMGALWHATCAEADGIPGG